MENLRNKADVKLVRNKKYYLKWTWKPSCIPQKIFDNDIVTIRESKITLTLNKSACVGMCILDLSKLLTYKFHHDYIKNKLSNNSRLLFTDTDSLMYEIKSEDFYEDFSKDKEMFDFKNYSPKPKYYDDSNKIVVGRMKDETSGVAIEEFIGLKPKICSF